MTFIPGRAVFALRGHASAQPGTLFARRGMTSISGSRTVAPCLRRSHRLPGGVLRKPGAQLREARSARVRKPGRGRGALGATVRAGPRARSVTSYDDFDGALAVRPRPIGPLPVFRHERAPARQRAITSLVRRAVEGSSCGYSVAETSTLIGLVRPEMSTAITRK